MKEFAGKHFLLIVENNSLPLDARVWREALSLNDAGARVSAICPIMRDNRLPYEELNGIHIYRYPVKFSDGSARGYVREYLTSFIRTLVLLHRLLFRGPRIHVVHVANPPDIFWPLAIYLRLLGTRFIFDEHDLTPEAYLSRFAITEQDGGMMYRALVFMERLSYRFSHAIIATNESYRAHAISVRKSYASKTFVVRNGPDTRVFGPVKPVPEYRKDRKYLAAYMGIMAVQDGVDYIIRAVDVLVNQMNFRDFIVYLIGMGDEWENLKELSTKLELDAYIVFTGFIPRSVTLEILSTADICLSPDPINPLNDISTMNKVMEYMAIGKPMVSFHLREAEFSAGDAALYVTNNDERAFAEGMLYLFGHPEKGIEMGRVGKRRIDELLCWQRQADHLLSVYRYLQQGKKGREYNTNPVSTEPPGGGRALDALLKLQDGMRLQTGSGEGIEEYLFEQYKETEPHRRLAVYYLLKPLIPSGVRLALRRRYSSMQARMTFPRWPIEPVVTDQVDRTLLNAIQAGGGNPVHRLSPWPSGHTAAFVITHDVEWDDGLQRAHLLAEIEQSLGFRSSWYIVPERYPIDWSVIEQLRAAGCEIGVHGLRHDGTLFRSRREFEEKVRRINGYLAEWKASGFRSESTLRRSDWMPEIEALYDSSFPDTDPYEPVAGGCCSIWPYFLGSLVELPITMPQDHTLFDILRHTDTAVWDTKADWIQTHGGMILIDVHPDYMTTPERLKLYRSFLERMKQRQGIWQALPREVAEWWIARDASSLDYENGAWSIRGIPGRGGVIRSSWDGVALRHEHIASGAD